MALRFGIAGTGYWAREVHLPGILQTDGAELVGVWGRTPGLVEEIARNHRIQPFGRLSDMLAEVDAVSIAVAPSAQPDIALAAAQAGKHLLLEKPVALTVEQARAVEAAVQKAGVANLVFFMRLFVPEISAAIEAERRFEWTHGSVRVHSPVMVTDSPYRDSRWRQEPAAALWDIGPHVLSILLRLLGDVTSIDASLGTGNNVLMKTVHRDGAVADISLTLHAGPHEVANEYRFTSPTRELLLPNPDLQRPETFSRAVSELIAQVISGRRADASGIAVGAEIVELLAKAERTLGAKRPVA
jgi:predicted dehydrogenase